MTAIVGRRTARPAARVARRAGRCADVEAGAARPGRLGRPRGRRLAAARRRTSWRRTSTRTSRGTSRTRWPRATTRTCGGWSTTRSPARTSRRWRTTSARPRAEDLVRRSGLAWTILQPGVYVQNFDLTRPVPVPYDVHARFGFLDLADLGEAAATVLTEDGHEGATYELASRPVLGRGAGGRGRDRRPSASTRPTRPRGCGRCSPTTTRTACPPAPCRCGRCCGGPRSSSC